MRDLICPSSQVYTPVQESFSSGGSVAMSMLNQAFLRKSIDKSIATRLASGSKRRDAGILETRHNIGAVPALLRPSATHQRRHHKQCLPKARPTTQRASSPPMLLRPRHLSRALLPIAKASMSTFTLPNTTPAIPVTLPQDLTQAQLLSFPAFKTWLKTLQHSLSLQTQKSHTFNPDPYVLRQITIQAVDYFGRDRLGFIKLKADVSNAAGEHLPGSVFLRGGSVAMMLILQPNTSPPSSETDKHVLLTLQPRLPAGSLSFPELPAGMLDNGTFAGAAATEIREETGLEIAESDLLDMTSLALSLPTSFSSPASLSHNPHGSKGFLPTTSEGEEEAKESLQMAVYPSPGGSDEYLPIFLYQKRVAVEELDALRGKLTGLRAEGEKITLMVVRLEELWKVGGRDAKALAAWALYEGLRKEGRI